MKRLLALLCAAACIGAASAQTTAYVCDGYDYDAVTLTDPTNVTFSTDQSEVTIGDETFDVDDVDSIVFHEPQYNCVTVTYSGTSATVDIPSTISGVTSSVSGAHVTLTSTNTSDEILYVVSGTSTNGSLTITGSYKMRIHLNGVNLTSLKGAPFVIDCGKRIEVKLMKGTTNTFVDNASGAQKACFYVKGHLELKGKGTLNVTGNTKHAIGVGEYLQLKSSTGTINVLGAVSDGIHCGKGVAGTEHNQFIMNGGTLNISGCGSDCIDADDYGAMRINDGTITLDISQDDGTGMKCDSLFCLNGGDLTINVSGQISQGIRTNYNATFAGGTLTENISGDGSKAVKAKYTVTSETVNSGGNATFSGTTADITLTGGTYTAESTKCGGLYIDKVLTQTAGTVTITVSNSAAVARKYGSLVETGGTYTEQ